MNSLTIIGRRWFQRTYGNTYHTVVVWIDGKQVYSSPKAYGYGSQYEQTAVEWLNKNGYPDIRFPLSLYCRNNGIALVDQVIDVPRERDL